MAMLRIRDSVLALKMLPEPLLLLRTSGPRSPPEVFLGPRLAHRICGWRFSRFGALAEVRMTFGLRLRVWCWI